MPVLKFHDFVGRIPILHKTKLPANAAQVCNNAVVESGALVPAKTLGSGSSLGSSRRQTAYYIPDYAWKSWDAVVDVIPAPVVNDDHRFFFAGVGQGYPKVCSETLEAAGATRRLGVLMPNYANDGDPLVMLPTGTGNGTVKHVVSYAYTVVDEFGGESVLSTATAPWDLEEGQCMELTNFRTNSLGLYGNSITGFRLYRRVTLESGVGDWFWVKARVGSADGTAYWELTVDLVDSHTVKVYDSNGAPGASDYDLGEIGDNCESQDYDVPPEDGIGMTEIQNGVMLLWSAHQVCPNVPFIYHAFPEAYRFDFAETIMGVGIYNETALVATDGQPYLIGGVSPANYIKKKLPFPWPCVSRRSVVSSNIGVFYASTRGMVWWNGSGIKLITENVISESQWAALNPSSMIAFFYKGRVYVFSYGDDLGFILDVSGTQPYIMDIDLPYNVFGGFTDAGTDDLRLICLSSGAYRVHNYGAGANLTLEWTSREIVTPAMNFSSIKILGSGWGVCGLATVRVYGDGTLRDTVTVDGDTVVRLSSGYRASRWHIEVEMSCGLLEAVALGTSMGELAYV